MTMRHTMPLCALFLTWSSLAFAADDSVVSTARELAEQGLTEFDAGHYEQAAQMLLKAYRAVRVPTLARHRGPKGRAG